MFPWLSIPEGFILNCLSMASITVRSSVNIWIINVLSVTILWTVPVADHYELRVSKHHLRSDFSWCHLGTNINFNLYPKTTGHLSRVFPAFAWWQLSKGRAGESDCRWCKTEDVTQKVTNHLQPYWTLYKSHNVALPIVKLLQCQQLNPVISCFCEVILDQTSSCTWVRQ